MERRLGMDNKGWISLHRKSLTSTVWTDEVVWKVWCWCLFRASANERVVKVGNFDVLLEEGEFVTGRIAGSKECGFTIAKWRRAIQTLINTQRITHKTHKKTTHKSTHKAAGDYSIIKVLNWNLYQRNNPYNDPYSNDKINPPPTHKSTHKNDSFTGSKNREFSNWSTHKSTTNNNYIYKEKEKNKKEKEGNPYGSRYINQDDII